MKSLNSCMISGWMIINCAKSCNACELRDPKLRCNRERLGIAGPSYMPGDMESMFGSIESRFQGIYNITVLSKDPWVVILDGFLADDESKALITTVDKWERSTDTGSSNEFGEAGRVVSQGRTSSNAWCREQCENVSIYSLNFQSLETRFIQITIIV